MQQSPSTSPQTRGYSKTKLKKMKVEELRKTCQDLRLSTVGSKAQLIERISTHSAPTSISSQNPATQTPKHTPFPASSSRASSPSSCSCCSSSPSSSPSSSSSSSSSSSPSSFSQSWNFQGPNAKLFPSSPEEAEKMFEKCPPEKLGVDTSIKGTLPLGTSPTEKFFCEHMDLEDWVSKELLPPPSPTFYRSQKKLVYVVANDEYELRDLGKMPHLWFASVANFEHPLRWIRTNIPMDAVVLLLPGVFDKNSLAMDLCSHPRLEIIGVGTTNGHVQLSGTPGGGFPLDDDENSPAMSLKKGPLGKNRGDAPVVMRINNVTIRQDAREPAVSITGDNFLELDTVSLYSKWATGICSGRDSFNLLRNVRLNAKENGIRAGGGLIVLNSNFHGCGSDQYEIDEDTVYREYASIKLEHHTHFLMWNSRVQNSYGHPIGKNRKVEYDPKTQKQYELYVQLATLRLGGLPHGLDPQEAISYLASDSKRLEALPEGHRRLRNTTLVNNRQCNEWCGSWLNDPLKGYCPNMDEETELGVAQKVSKIRERIMGFNRKEKAELVKEHRRAMEKWDLEGVVDPKFLTSEQWREYVEAREFDESMNNSAEDDCNDAPPHILRKKTEEPLKNLLKKFSFSEEFVGRLVRSILYTHTDIVWEDTVSYESFESRTRVYSLLGNGVFVDFKYMTDVRTGTSKVDNFDILSVDFVGHAQGVFYRSDKRSVKGIDKRNWVGSEGVVLLKRSADYTQEFEDGTREQFPDEEYMQAGGLFDILQEVLFGKKMMSLPQFVAFLWVMVGAQYFSRSPSGVGFALKLAKKEESRP